MSKGFKLYNGNCLDVMKGFEKSSVDAIVTDPPYGFSFMGNKWDYDVPTVDVWREAFRVLKPGAHLLAFFGSRTYHRGVVQIEDAGFEIRDQIMWVYGSGFPKSLDVSKAIDAQRTEDREPVRVICRVIRAAMDKKGLKSRDLVQHFGNCHSRLIDHWAARDTDSQPSLPTWEQWETLRDVLGIAGEHDAEVWRLNGRKGSPGDAYQQRPDAEHASAPGMRESWTDGKGWTGTTAKGGEGVTEAARQWQGWGTALKPAHEPIVVARKPLVGTVAANVQAFGTGAINIDGCRIELNGDYKCKANGRPSQTGLGDNYDPTKANMADSVGRWPSNLIHDGSEEVLAGFPQAKGAVSNGRKGVAGVFDDGIGASEQRPGYGDSGSAARFFYCAKASKADREEGNNHPTVKPTDLMRYLCRLVTPQGGVVLDPFTGSGSTGKAAILEGFRFIGVEMNPEYCAIAEARIQAAHETKKELLL